MRKLQPEVIAVCQLGTTAYRPTRWNRVCLAVALVSAMAANAGPRPDIPENHLPSNSQVQTDSGNSVLQRPITDARENPAPADSSAADEAGEDC